MYTKISTYLFLALILLFAITLDAKAQNKTWTGAIDSSWNTVGNWNPSGVPSSNQTVGIPANITPRPVLTSDVTIKSIDIRESSITIRNNATLTLTDKLTLNKEGELNIANGRVLMTGDKFEMKSSSSVINMTSGSFIAGKDVKIHGTFNLGNGTLEVPGKFEITKNSTFNAQNGTVTVDRTTSITGTYNGDNGSTFFNERVTIRESNGVLNLGSGDITFNGGISFEEYSTVNFGSGTVTINGNISAKKGVKFNVEDADVTINGNATFDDGGKLAIDAGTLTITGDAKVDDGSTLDLNSGTLNVTGKFTIEEKGRINAGNSTINLEGDLVLKDGGRFNPDSSTVIFSGTDQTIDSRIDINFHNVIVETGTTVTTKVRGKTITIENDLTVKTDGSIDIVGNDEIDVQGQIEGNGNVSSPNPYVVSAIAPTLTELNLTFNMEMDQSTAENLSNYTLKRVSDGSSVSITSLSLNTGGNNKVVTVVMATILEDVEYEITMNNVRSTTNKKVSKNHKNRFIKAGPIKFYSRKTGDWAASDTWSRTSHSGASDGTHPTNTIDAIIIIGDGHVVTATGTASIIKQTSLEIKVGSKLVIGSGGTYKAGSKVVTGAGTFEVTSGTLEIGSTTGISSSGATGNIQTTTRTFSTSGSYTYNGSGAQIVGNGLPSTVNNFTLSNVSGVTLSNNLQVNGTLYLNSGSLIVNSGFNLIANTKSVVSGKLVMKRSITGSRGWRLFSSPIATTYGDLLDGIVTQGYTGSALGKAPLDSLQPNVMYYLESYSVNENGKPATDNDRWRAPVSAATSLSPERGLYTYVFGNIPADSRYNDNLPATLTVEGQEHSGSIDFNVTYTTAADSGWSLLGNPYAATIDWDDNSNWTKTNIDNTIYLWDYSTNQYKTWNGTTGDLGNGLIAPFQGFWVKANATSPSLIVQEDAKTTGGVFVGKAMVSNNESQPSFSLTLSDDYNTAATHFMFSEGGKNGKDHKDAFRLVPPPGIPSYLDLASVTQNGDRLSINNLPRKFGIPIEIPLFVHAYEIGNPKKKAMHFIFDNFKNIPQGWTIKLVDTKTGEEINIEESKTYLFEFEGFKSKSTPNSTFGAKPKITHKAKPANSRFVVRIETGEDAIDLPNKFELKQNFPNPFNPSTNIRFTLPVQSYTTLTIYDILGREITTLVSKELDAGEYTFKWDSANLASGVYLYRLVNKNGVFTKKMTLIK